MRVELVDHGQHGKRVEIQLWEGKGDHSLKLGEARKLANWILELLPDANDGACDPWEGLTDGEREAEIAKLKRPPLLARLGDDYRPGLQEIDYVLLPAHLRGGMQRYLEEGMLPGQFLQAVLKNDLADAFARADVESMQAMVGIVAWLHMECPGTAWGSEEKIQAWAKERSGDGST